MQYLARFVRSSLSCRRECTVSEKHRLDRPVSAVSDASTRPPSQPSTMMPAAPGSPSAEKEKLPKDMMTHESSVNLLAALDGANRRLVASPHKRAKKRSSSPSQETHSTSTSVYNMVAICSRVFHRLFCSEHAAFGLRGACAMMSIAIIGFLHSSRSFYAAQRFLWAL